MSDMIRGDRRVLVFSAHAADFCSRAGGTIARLTEAGSQVHIVDFTYGERCESPALWARDPAPSIEEVKAIRADEIKAAAGVLGATSQCLDFDDCPLLIGAERSNQLLDLLRAQAPDLLLTHWHRDIMHPDHVAATEAVIWASRYCFRPGLDGADPVPSPQVVFYETTLGTAPVARYIPSVFVDISQTIDRKREALEKFEAQPGLAERYRWLARYRALEAQSTAWMKGCEYAEGFVRFGSEAAGFDGPEGFGP
ncbi:MAG: PIG-L deacetylase family protein [Candidatus Latescibacterota bacterium]|nr:PIG-L deacetylase family protein [Candidatus Latescibacterota bacterium]